MKNSPSIKMAFLLGILSILIGCKNAQEPVQSSTEKAQLSSPVLDTLIHTYPLDYMQRLDTVDASKKSKIASYKELLDLFEKLNYTPEAWQAGIREIPRAYLTQIGDKWGTTTSNEVTVENKKRLFFRGIAPLILHSNELIMEDRNRLEKIRASFQQNNSLDETDKIWVFKLAKLYKVKTSEDQVTDSMLNELWEKVDIIPASLALAQAAEESGWGTSRFAASGNAIYGQWSWGENAMTPEKQRKELGNYGIASFGSLQESVSAYMINLNTHNAYSSLRDKRAELRKNGEKLTGSVLAEKLDKYSERGMDYVNGLKSMMEYNKLSPVDDAYLSKDAPIYLFPAASE